MTCNMSSVFRLSLLLSLIGLSCLELSNTIPSTAVQSEQRKVTIKILGTIQDAGYPQINCHKSCCRNKWQESELSFFVSCLGLTDNRNHKAWLFDATPDMKYQWEAISNNVNTVEGIFISHAHIGHYTGLMHLGREALGASKQKVYAMPRMKEFLEENGPWDQLIKLENITLIPINNDSTLQLQSDIFVTPLLVPHRDEYSETVGFYIEGPDKSVLFIPDIDKWHLWSESIVEWVKKVDYAFLDATFYDNGEIRGRDMSQIPHPFVVESMSTLKSLSAEDKASVYFIHLNHTNPLLIPDSEATKHVKDSGFNIAREGQEFVI